MLVSSTDEALMDDSSSMFPLQGTHSYKMCCYARLIYWLNATQTLDIFTVSPTSWFSLMFSFDSSYLGVVDIECCEENDFTGATLC